MPSKLKRTPVPLGSNVVIKRSSCELTIGHIVIPKTKHSDKTTTGIVAAIGPKVYDVKPKDKVHFSRYAGSEATFELDGESYLIIPESQIHGVTE